MLRQLLLIILCWPVLTGLAAEKDSTELFLSRKDLPSQAKVDFLNMIARDLAYVNPMKGAEFSYRALQISQQINYTKGQAQALRGVAIGLIAEDQFYHALKNLQRSIHLFESLNDSAGIAGCYISMGHAYRRLLDRDKELYFHQQAFNYFQGKHDAERIAVTTHNLGEAFLNVGLFDRAIRLTDRAIILNDSLKNYTVLSSCYKTMGNIWMKKNDLSRAEEYFNKVLKLSAQLGENSQKIATVDALLNLSRIANKENKQALATSYLEQATVLVKKYRLYDFVTPVYEGLIQQYTQQKKLDKISEAVRDYNKTNDQLNQTKTEVIGHFAEILMKSDTLEHFNLALKEKSALQEKLIVEKNNRNTITVILLLALLVLATFLTIGLLKLRHNNNYLTAQRTIIRTQNKELEELNAVKDKFLSILSHDIKAPLIGLNSYADLLTSEKVPVDSKQLALFGKELKDQLEGTSAMADNLITWVKLQMKSFVTQPVLVDLTLALAEVYKLYGPVVEQKKIKLEHREEDHTYVWADRNQLDFILRNLINNAIKYSFQEGTITVNLFRKGEETILRIADQGIGMSNQTMKSVSGLSHFRSMSGTAGEGGTGLGLRICREFAELNKGKIEVVSTEGKGSVFTLSLPANQV